MKIILMGLILLVTATAASAEWTSIGASDEYIPYVDKGTIRRNGNLVKMWDLRDWKTVKTSDGDSYLSEKSQTEYDCKKENFRILAFARFDGKMGNGKVVYHTSETSLKWLPIQPESVSEALWKIACGKK